MRKLFISADIEGIASVASQHALAPDRWEWAAARQWMTAEAVAVAEAAFGAGYDEVIVADGHGNAHNIDPDKLPDNVCLVRSWPRPLLQMQGVEHAGVEACAFIGYHAGATAPAGLLAHTYHGGACRAIRLNSVDCSEGYLNAALAGAFGRPVVLVSGDAETVADAARYAPHAESYITKQAIGWRAAASLPPAQVRRALAEAAARAFARPLPPPFLVPGPYVLDLEMASVLAAEMLAYLPGVTRVDGYTVRTEIAALDALMAFVAFAMLYSPTGTIAI